MKDLEAIVETLAKILEAKGLKEARTWRSSLGGIDGRGGGGSGWKQTPYCRRRWCSRYRENCRLGDICMLLTLSRALLLIMLANITYLVAVRAVRNRLLNNNTGIT